MTTRQALIEMIADSIDSGELTTEDLRTLGSFIKLRIADKKAEKTAEVAGQIGPGSNVRISPNANLSPRYVLGTYAKVVRVNRTRAVIVLGHVNSPGSDSRFYTGQEITCPINALEVVEAG